MKTPDRFIGYIDFEDSVFPFYFNEEAFELTLLPPTVEKWEEASSLIDFLAELCNESTNAETKHEWVKDIILKGFTVDGNKVIFNVMENRSNYNGIFSYNVNWYLYHSANALPEAISRFKAIGPEIDSFFPPIVALNSSITDNEQTKSYIGVTVSSNGYITKELGVYRIASNLDAIMSVSSYSIANIRNASKPISAVSSIETMFSRPVDYSVLIEAVSYLSTFLKIISYRKNITLNRIEVAFKNKQEQDDYLGILCLKKRMDTETDKKRSGRIIKHSILDQKVAEIIINIKDGKYSIRHLCDSIQSTRSYSSSRIIMILAAFERTYRNTYGVDFGRSEEYIAVKEEIIELINNYAETKHGRYKRYAKALRDYVNNRDSSFGDNLKRALIDHKEIMRPFVEKRYRGNYEETVENISLRMGEVRNGIAHDKLDWHFDAIHLSDISIVEELLYAMILKDLKLDSRKIQKGINDLFDENFAISIS